MVDSPHLNRQAGTILPMVNLNPSEVLTMTPGLIWLVTVPSTQNIVLMSVIGFLVMVSALAYLVS
jgi:hypothetical protein